MDNPPLLPPPASKPWGIFGTLLWGFFVHVAAIFVWVAALVAFFGPVWRAQPGSPTPALWDSLYFDLSTTSAWIATMVAGVTLLVWVTRVPFREYLALRLPSGQATTVYMAVTLLWIAAIQVLAPSLGHYPGLFFSDAPRGPWWIFILVATLRLFGIPAAIELLVRGFVYHGLTAGRRTAIPGLVLTTLLAVGPHCLFFASGPVYWVLATCESLLLGIARYRSGSLLLPLLLHALLVIGLFGGALLQGPH